MGPSDRLKSPRALARLMRLRIPYALNAVRHPLLASEVSPGDSLICPCCLKPVELRERAQQQAHFVHDRPSRCALESMGWLEHSATWAVFGGLVRWLRGIGPSPEIVRSCPCCRAERRQSLPGDLKSVEQRRVFGGTRSRVLSLELFRAGDRPAALIHMDSPQRDEQGDEVGRADLPWLLLRAEQVLAEPLLWRPKALGRLRKLDCSCLRASRADGRKW